MNVATDHLTWRAKCPECGWLGPERIHESEAEVDWENHAEDGCVPT